MLRTEMRAKKMIELKNERLIALTFYLLIYTMTSVPTYTIVGDTTV